MKTHPISILVLAGVAGIASGCARAESAEADLIERATAVKPVLVGTTIESATAEVANPIETPSDEPATAAVLPEETKKRADESFVPDLETVDGLSLVRFVTAPAIDHREPVRASSRFAAAEKRVYAFVEASNESDVPRSLTVHFIGPRDEVGGGVELEIPGSSPRWRTWAYTRHANSPGLWRVEIRDEDGALVGALPFEVEGPDEDE